MCGRFTLTVDPADLQEAFADYSFPSKFAARYNIAPSQPVMAIPNDGQRKADFLVWGLIPTWAKDPAIGSRLINARAETLAEKPSFRGSLKYKRCLILADGFYEWKSEPGKKTKVPHFIQMKDGKPFAFAGLWDLWQSPEGSQVKSCTIVTTEPNELVSSIHNRMPVILDPSHYKAWLDPEPQKPEAVLPFLKPFPANLMSAFPVSTQVNKPANDSPELIAPV